MKLIFKSIKFSLIPTIFIFLIGSFINFNFEWFLEYFMNPESKGRIFRTVIFCIEIIFFIFIYNYLSVKEKQNEKN